MHMDKITEGYNQLIERLTAWAQAQENIRIATLIGSRARTDHPADEWSDLDVFIAARDIRVYVDSAA